jgi:D-3-phosphoglycerate dehydrogenase
MKILITDAVDAQCRAILEEEGFEVDYRPGLARPAIKEALAGAAALVVRSQTQVDAELLGAAPDLKIIGRAGAGVDNIDVGAATRKGIIVMNTPGGNTISTAEHTMAMILALSRNIPQANQSLREKKWDRKSYVGTELFEKTLGIVGLGKVGVEVARRASSFSMHVIAYDPVLSEDAAKKFGAELVPLDEIFRTSDYISIHSPLIPETTDLLDAQAFALCKRGVRIINCARGGIVNEHALLEALTSKKVAGAALDVFTEEPPVDFTLINHPNVIATPHLGASTEEAQEKVAVQIAHQIADALRGRGLAGLVNAGMVQMTTKKELHPFALLGEKMGSAMAQMKLGKLRSIVVSASGSLLTDALDGLGAAVLKGFFERLLEEPINYVNSLSVARERGIGIELRKLPDDANYTHVLGVEFLFGSAARAMSGTVFGIDDVRIVSIDSFHLDLVPSGNLLFYRNIDRPGMLAGVSTILSRAGINIARLTLGRVGTMSQALTIVATDTRVPDAVLKEIAGIQGVTDVLEMAL